MGNRDSPFDLLLSLFSLTLLIGGCQIFSDTDICFSI